MLRYYAYIFALFLWTAPSIGSTQHCEVSETTDACRIRTAQNLKVLINDLAKDDKAFGNLYPHAKESITTANEILGLSEADLTKLFGCNASLMHLLQIKCLNDSKSHLLAFRNIGYDLLSIAKNQLYINSVISIWLKVEMDAVSSKLYDQVGTDTAGLLVEKILEACEEKIKSNQCPFSDANIVLLTPTLEIVMLCAARPNQLNQMDGKHITTLQSHLKSVLEDDSIKINEDDTKLLTYIVIISNHKDKKKMHALRSEYYLLKALKHLRLMTCNYSGAQLAVEKMILLFSLPTVAQKIFGVTSQIKEFTENFRTILETQKTPRQVALQVIQQRMAGLQQNQ